MEQKLKVLFPLLDFIHASYSFSHYNSIRFGFRRQKHRGICQDQGLLACPDEPAPESLVAVELAP